MWDTWHIFHKPAIPLRCGRIVNVDNLLTEILNLINLLFLHPCLTVR